MKLPRANVAQRSADWDPYKLLTYITAASDAAGSAWRMIREESGDPETRGIEERIAANVNEALHQLSFAEKRARALVEKRGRIWTAATGR